MTRGERGGNFREKGEGFVGTIIKDTWTITGGGQGMGGRWGGLGVRMGGRQRTVLELQ